MTALQAQDFCCAADVPVVFVELLEELQPATRRYTGYLDTSFNAIDPSRFQNEIFPKWDKLGSGVICFAPAKRGYKIH